MHAGDRSSIPNATDVSRKNSPNAKNSAKGVCQGSLDITIIKLGPCHSSCGTLKNPHCPIAMSAV